VTHSTCGSGASWCARTDELFGVDGIHVLDVSTRDDGTVVLDVETDQSLAGCRSCGVTVTVEHAALDPFRGYANAIRDQLPDAVAVLDAFTSSSAPKPSTKSAACSNRPWADADTKTTRSTGSAGAC
jgi:hypothetical protein